MMTERAKLGWPTRLMSAVRCRSPVVPSSAPEAAIETRYDPGTASNPGRLMVAPVVALASRIASRSVQWPTTAPAQAPGLTPSNCVLTQNVGPVGAAGACGPPDVSVVLAPARPTGI